MNDNITSMVEHSNKKKPKISCVSRKAEIIDFHHNSKEWEIMEMVWQLKRG